MATEFSDEFYDEITGSEKRVGCIGGIFQLFDCQQLLGHMKDASGSNDQIPMNQTTDHLSRSLEKGRIRKGQEKSRDSTESSRTSLSSSFTSFSSMDHKSQQEEPIYVHRSFFSKSPRSSPRSAFKDIIKESIYKNVRDALMINKDENKINREMKPIHSPRSMDLCKINDLDESLRILYKLKDNARFSYDGTDNTQTVLDMKHSSKHKESSRHSLDSKKESLRCNLSTKFNSALKKIDKDDDRKVSLNQIRDMEIGQKSPNIVAKLMGLEPLDESKDEKPLQSPRNTANMKQKFEYLLEKRLKKASYQHSSNELHDPKLTTETSNKKLSSVNSPRAQIAPPNYKFNKLRTSESSIKSPIVVLEPARKFDVCFSEVAELDGPLDLEKIRTGGLSKRKKDMFKRQINTISPQLQQIKVDMEKKDYGSILTCDMIKSPKQYINCQSSDSLSPRCKLRQKPSKLKDSELQNPVDQVNVEEYRVKRLFERNNQLKKSIQGSSIKIGTSPSVSEEKNYSMILKDHSANELELVLSPQRSSPNSVLDALLKEGGLTHSPVSVSNEECQDLPSDRSPRIHPSILSSSKNHQKQEGIETIFRKSRVLGRTNEELHAADGHATEIFQASGLLHKESDMLSMFDQINSNNPSKFVEKTNPKKLQQKLISDAVNEILAEKIEIFSSHAYTIKCLQKCREKNLDENSKVHRKLLQSSQVWDSSQSEVPVIVLEIERLIFKDLINEVVNGEITVFLEAKQKWRRAQHFARNGI